MTCRGLCLAVLALFAALPAANANAGEPEGPRLAFVKWGPKPFDLALLSVGPTGSGLAEIVGGRGERSGAPLPPNGPTWSPDGRLLAFGGAVGKRKQGLYLAKADGTGMQMVPGTVGGSTPVFSPSGGELAFARTRIVEPPFDPKHPLESLTRDGFAGTTTWLLDLATGQQKRLTPWRDGLHVEPSSFAPDGATLALSRQSPRGDDAVALRIADRKTTVIARNAEEPVYSPDGSRIAFVSYSDRNVTEGFDEPVLASELYVRPTVGGQRLRLTRTPRWQESSPSWDPSGERLAYTQSTDEESIALGFTNVIKQINGDGTCRELIFGKPHKPRARTDPVFAGLHGPRWQPGPGREAGRIDC